MQFGKEIDFPIKTTVLGIFDFRHFLNIGMLLTTSERAKQLRAMMLDVVIATITKKAGERGVLSVKDGEEGGATPIVAVHGEREEGGIWDDWCSDRMGFVRLQ